MKYVHLLGAVASAAIVVMTAAWSLSVLGEELSPVADVVLPAPTGAFAVGRTVYEWTDPARDEMFSDVDGERRSLLAWIWYPAEVSSAPASDYMPGALGAFVEAATGLSPSKVQVPAQDNAPLAGTSAQYPVLVFSHGSGAAVAIYTAMLTEIASHGYIVVAVQHPYNAMFTAFTDGRTIAASPDADGDTVQYWSEDTAFVVDKLEAMSAADNRFAGRLDLSRLGIFGHSFGGAAAAEFCLDDARCVAGLNFDGSLSGDVEKVGTTRPFMQIFSGTNCEDVAAVGVMTRDECRPLLERYQAGWQKMFDTSEAAYRITVAGSKHGSFSDVPFLAPLSPMFANNAEILPDRAWQIATQYALSFFNRHLNNSSEPFPTFPEATLESLIGAQRQTKERSRCPGRGRPLTESSGHRFL
jgi:predicted dienelactone hydrolase